jgi:RES domain-containing protein
VPRLKAWRLSKQRYAERAFSGEGARILGGRWNSVGVPVVYTSLSLSLAVLEVFVHMTASAEPEDYVYVAADLGVDELKAERIRMDRLPDDWKRLNHPALQALGDEWSSSMRSLILLVPSVVVEGEWNALINPLHPDAVGIVIEKPKPFHFDERLFKTKGNLVHSN